MTEPTGARFHTTRRHCARLNALDWRCGSLLVGSRKRGAGSAKRRTRSKERLHSLRSKLNALRSVLHWLLRFLRNAFCKSMITSLVKLLRQLEQWAADICGPLPDLHVLKSKQCFFHKNLKRGDGSVESSYPPLPAPCSPLPRQQRFQNQTLPKTRFDRPNFQRFAHRALQPLRKPVRPPVGDDALAGSPHLTQGWGSREQGTGS